MQILHIKVTNLKIDSAPEATLADPIGIRNVSSIEELYKALTNLARSHKTASGKEITNVELIFS